MKIQNAWILLTITLSMFGSPSHLLGQSFMFTKIADDTNTPRIPALNNLGDVVFNFTNGILPGLGGISGIAIGNGVQTTTVVTNDMNVFIGSGTRPEINDSGDIVFISSFEIAPRVFESAVYKTVDGTLTTIADTAGGTFSVFNAATINNSGMVAIGAAKTGDGRFSIFVENGGGVTPVAEADENGGFIGPLINNSGALTFKAVQPSLANGGFETVITTPSGAIVPIAPMEVNANFPRSINEDGEVLIQSELGSGMSLVSKAQLNTQPVRIVDTEGVLSRFKGMSINNSGDVAILASQADGELILFLGSDPVNDKLIMTGDMLDGSIVTSLEFGSSGLNDEGQVAFLATLADGRFSVYRADPIGGGDIPEPTTSAILTIGCLALFRRSNVSSGDEGRKNQEIGKEKVPGKRKGDWNLNYYAIGQLGFILQIF